MLDYFFFILLLRIVWLDDAIDKLKTIEYKTAQTYSEYELTYHFKKN